MSVSVVIVNWNARDHLLTCVDSLRGQMPDDELEVIIVDNASVDRSAAAMRAQFPHVRLIENEHNVGLAAANNQGISAAHGDIIVISNPDVLYLPGSVRALVDLLERRPRAAFVFAKLLGPDGGVETAAGDLPTLREALLGRNRLARAGKMRLSAAMWWDGWGHNEEVQIGHGAEACYAVRRSALDDIGLQDERFFLDWEGIDWCARATETGWEIWFCPSAEVVHIGSRSIGKAKGRWVIASHRGLYRYFAKRLPLLARLPLAAVVLVRAIAKLAAVKSGRGFYSRHLQR